MPEANCETRPDPGRTAGPSAEEIAAAQDELGVSPATNLIGLLQEIQDHFGYLPPPALDQISRRTRTPLSRIYGVVSFYAQFYTEPRGRHTIRCCRGTACHVKGADGVIDSITRVLGVRDGETTEDMMFDLETVACLGTCFLAPAMMIDSRYYGSLTPQSIEKIFASYRNGS